MSRTSRRQFLKSTLYAGVALGAVRSVSPMVLFSQENAALSEKLTCAILGVNSRGGSHIGGFLNNPNTVITYIVDVDSQVGEARCQQIEQKQGFRPKFVRDMREAFADDGLDIVSVATPNHWHALASIWAMQAGKDVYVEKPASQNIFEGCTMVAAAAKYGRVCQVGTQCRSNGAQREAVQFLREGGIGEVNFARGLCYKRRRAIGPRGDYPIPEQVDFNLWSGPAIYTEPRVTRQKFHYDWHWQRLYGNGDSGNQGPHQFDIARWGLGLMRLPNRILTYGGRLGYDVEKKDPHYVDAGDTANTEVSILDFGDKTMVFETRGLETPAYNDVSIGVHFYGSEGSLRQVSYGYSVAYDRDGKVIREFKGGDDQIHYDNFIEAVMKRDASLLNTPVLEGHLSAALAHLGNISYYLGESNYQSVAEIGKVLEGVESRDENAATLARTVEHLQTNGVDLEKTPLSLGAQLTFNPDTMQFVDNDAANALLSRTWREGFVCPSATEV